MRAALIGLGMVSATHLKAIAATGTELELQGVCGSKPESARRFLEQQLETIGAMKQVPIAYDNVDAVMADPAVDFVIVCTPPNARMEIVRACIAADKPILMEKPIERTLESAEEIVTMCEKAGLPLGIVFQHRCREASIALRGLVDEGGLGGLIAVEVAVPWWRPQSYYDEPGRGSYDRDGGGVLISQAIHTLDLMMSFTGPAVEVRSLVKTTAAHQMEAEDFVVAGVEFETGAVGSIFASTASFPGTSESIRLHCANASVHMEGNSLDIRWRDGRHQSIGAEAKTGGGADPMAFSHSWHQSVIEDFADAIKMKRAPLVTGREALKVHRLIEAIEDGAAG